MRRPPRRPAPAAAAAVATVVAALAASAALAHDTWLLPTRSVLPPGVEATLDLTSGTAFPEPGTPIAPARATVARVRLAGREDALPAPRPAGRALRFRVPLRRAGVAVAWVSLAPRELALDAAQVAEYLAEVAAPDSVRRAYLAQPAPRRWRERYAKHAKTFVRVASPLRPVPARDTAWAVPTGAPLELVPEEDPTRLRAGDSIAVRVLRGGRPVFAFPVGLVGPGAAAGVVRRAGPGGRVAFRLPRAGHWLLRATDLRRPPAGDDVDWESDFATLTVVAR